MSDLAERVVIVARWCLDTPFMHQGRLPGVGLDCAGLVVVTLNAVGIEVRDYRGYGRVPNEGRLRRAIDGQPCLEPVEIAKAEAGDIVLVRFGREPTHIGILTGPQQIIHAYEQIGRVVEHRLDEIWQTQIVGAWRARGEA